MGERRVPCPRIRLVESPSTWRFMSEDGQLVEVTGFSDQERRTAALAFFEANTEKPKPTKASQVWVRIEGSSLIKRYVLKETRTLGTS